MTEEQPQAANLPTEILQNKRAIDLYLIAVGALSVMALLSIVGAIILAFVGKAIPGEVWTVVGIAVCALSVMLGGERQ